MGFNSKFNFDDVFTRSVLIGLLRLLDEVTIKYQLSDKSYEMKKIPFYPSATGTERFMQDFYTNSGYDCETTEIEGIYDVLPRAALKLSSGTIVESNLTNKFVRATYQREDENGQLRSYSAYVNMVPMEFRFDVVVLADLMLELLKIQDKIFSLFYRARTFNSTYMGFRIPCQAGFPADLGINKLYEYNFDSQSDGSQRPTLNFSIIVEAYFPIIDETTELFRGNLMKAIDFNLSISNVPTIEFGQDVIESKTVPIGTVSTGESLILNLFEIPNMTHWFKSTGLVQSESSTELISWKNSVINGNDIINITGTPIIKTPLYNGWPGIITDGISQTLEISDLQELTKLHAFFVVKTEELDLDGHILFENSSDLEQRFMLGWINGDLFWSIGYGEAQRVVAIKENAAEWKLIEVWFDGELGIMGMKLNNQLVETQNVDLKVIGSNSSAWLFSQMGVTNFLKINCTEIGIWNRKLTGREIEFVTNYFSNRYAFF